ncbi:hypothetical protein P0082_07470 [Candidatus Haliotispira prima]|uniref:Uncharacterized protein n=1 Tax=Candidatus Haliotispira prima TaxID=3034016 RepID=A0ABY8MFJ6_9SPIO|nr:hypothetical protein P0082_07470 [Candidatus Haliotispira prima]
MKKSCRAPAKCRQYFLPVGKFCGGKSVSVLCFLFAVFLGELLFFDALGHLGAYRWPLPSKQVVQGFLANRPIGNRATGDYAATQHALPNLGLWFELDDEESQNGAVRPYHSGEIIYFETSSDMDTLGTIPRNIYHTMIIEHGKLLFRYSGDKLKIRLQDGYRVDSDDVLFTPETKSRGDEVASESDEEEPKEDKIKPRLYMEVFDTQFQTVINPKLIMPGVNDGKRSSQPHLESVVLSGLNEGDAGITDESSAVVSRPLRRSDQLVNGIYNLSFRFLQSQGPPLQLHVNIDEKKVYSELFDQVYGINSKLIINDRDLQDLYIWDGREGRFFLGTINLQDNVNSSVRIFVDEEYIDGSHSINEYQVRIR